MGHVVVEEVTVELLWKKLERLEELVVYGPKSDACLHFSFFCVTTHLGMRARGNMPQAKTSRDHPALSSPSTQ